MFYRNILRGVLVPALWIVIGVMALIVLSPFWILRCSAAGHGWL